MLGYVKMIQPLWQESYRGSAHKCGLEQFLSPGEVIADLKAPDVLKTNVMYVNEKVYCTIIMVVILNMFGYVKMYTFIICIYMFL